MNPSPAAPNEHEAVIANQLAALDIHDKIALLTGSGTWTLHPLESIGMRTMAVSDGPAGVRGVTGSIEETAASFPSPTALAATFDRDLADRVGSLFAAEARRHGVDVVLAPVVNLHRTPLGGRHFECFSEDPRLTTDLAVTLIKAIQRHGVGACVKHFIANETETDRTEYTAIIDERTLREVYLPPFEAAVEAGVWMIMAAYNGIAFDGETAPSTEHFNLLTKLLKEEWGFDGVVVSDWAAARTTVPPANAGLDLVMPRTGGPWEDQLLKAVQSGDVDMSIIDDKVSRILRLGHRVGAFDVPPVVPPSIDSRALLREFAARSMVVIKDDNRQLPRSLDDLHRVAVIGPNAIDTFVQGGGSAHVNPDVVVTPADGLRAALGDHREVTVHRGGYARPHPPAMAMDTIAGETLRIELLDTDGAIVETRSASSSDLWIRDIPRTVTTARVTGIAHLQPGEHWIGVGTVGTFRIVADGELIGHGDHPAGNDVVLDSSVNAPPSHGRALVLDSERDVTITAELATIDADGWGRFSRMVLRHIPPGASVDDEIVAAEGAARDADLTVIIVGTNSEVESEGWDRKNLDLPGRQDELVRRVLAVDPNAIVVVNAGSPVLLPWLDIARTVVWSWFPGQECGHALADVLTGRTEPSGRLPWTLPAMWSDVPVTTTAPTDGAVTYDEGIHIGYRAYLRSGATPAAPFGHGLGWTDWSHDHIEVHEDGHDVIITVSVTNIGPRAGHEVVQAYISYVGDDVERPKRWLAGFTVVHAEPGDTTAATVRLRERDFAVWDSQAAAWRVPAGQYQIHIGRSIADIRLSTSLQR